MKVIVTGALGHIGSQLIRQFSKNFDDLEIVMIDDLSTQRYPSLFNLPKNLNFTFLQSRVQDTNLELVLESADCLVHLAATTDAAGTADNPDLVFSNNFEGTKVVADACLKADVPMIFPSSTSVYGSQDELVDEDCGELTPQSPYAECKIKEETYLEELFKNGLKGTICRLGTIYGTSPGMRFHTAVNKFCWQAVMGQPLSVWETALHQKRPYLDLDDCCKAFAWIIKNKMYSGTVYNVVSNNFTVKNVVDEIKKHKPSLGINMVQHKIMNQLSYEVSSDKFLKTGFNFKGSLSDAISETISLLESANG